MRYTYTVVLLVSFFFSFNTTAQDKAYAFRSKVSDSRTVVGSDSSVLPGYGYHIGYFYSPATIKENGVYHTFGCSADWGPIRPPNTPPTHGTWDLIRYSTSTDGKNWSEPKIILWANASSNNRSACDPSVVYLNGYLSSTHR